MRLEGIVKKGWGGEYIFATNDKYCGKIMYFHEGAKFSMHFHSEKDETWLVMQGRFEVKYIDTKDASMYSEILNEGDTWRNFPLEPHQLICLEEGVIVEVSTPDSVEDNYRVGKGDSQNASNG
jgi:mannose-6-phosphate isomerase-like protein (cupin superfamily)